METPGIFWVNIHVYIIYSIYSVYTVYIYMVKFGFADGVFNPKKFTGVNSTSHLLSIV